MRARTKRGAIGRSVTRSRCLGATADCASRARCPAIRSPRLADGASRVTPLLMHYTRSTYQCVCMICLRSAVSLDSHRSRSVHKSATFAFPAIEAGHVLIVRLYSTVCHRFSLLMARRMVLSEEWSGDDAELVFQGTQQEVQLAPLFTIATYICAPHNAQRGSLKSLDTALMSPSEPYGLANEVTLDAERHTAQWRIAYTLHGQEGLGVHGFGSRECTRTSAHVSDGVL